MEEEKKLKRQQLKLAFLLSKLHMQVLQSDSSKAEPVLRTLLVEQAHMVYLWHSHANR